jgi:D-glycero-alpha-D-manno-heptose 1-phosphate guanylyltransferase
MLQDLKAILLVGGLGTRLRSVVPSKPKALASIGERPFLELLVRQLSAQGICHLVLSTGYLAEQIEEVLGDGNEFGVTIEYSKEDTPLGTAGAIKLAQKFVQHDSEFLVLNGDSFLETDFGALVSFHRRHGGAASIAVVSVENASRYGTVLLRTDSRVQEFREKTGLDVPGIINAGIYVLGNAIFDRIADGPASLERDVFPRLLEHGVYAFEQRGIFIDIGTPDDYKKARQMCDRLTNAATFNGRSLKFSKRTRKEEANSNGSLNTW